MSRNVRNVEKFEKFEMSKNRNVEMSQCRPRRFDLAELFVVIVGTSETILDRFPISPTPTPTPTPPKPKTEIQKNEKEMASSVCLIKLAKEEMRRGGGEGSDVQMPVIK